MTVKRKHNLVRNVRSKGVINWSNGTSLPRVKRAREGPKGTSRSRVDLTVYVDYTSPPEYDDDTSVTMAKTFRSGGSVGAEKAKLPHYVSHIATPNDLILDYGAGETIPHTKWLRSLGLNVVAIDQKFNPSVHDPYASDRRYDIVMCSNVLNVQTRPENIVKVIYQLQHLIKPDGVVVVNYPENPRKIKDVTDRNIETVLRKFFRYVSKEDIKRYLGGYSHGWVCRL
jgi:hypothetical protein